MRGTWPHSNTVGSSRCMDLGAGEWRPEAVSAASLSKTPDVGMDLYTTDQVDPPEDDTANLKSLFFVVLVFVYSKGAVVRT